MTTAAILFMWAFFLVLIFGVPKLYQRQREWVARRRRARLLVDVAAGRRGGMSDDKREFRAHATEGLSEGSVSPGEPLEGAGSAGEPSFFSWDYVWVRVPEDFNPREYGIEFFVEGDGFVNKSDDVEVRLVQDIRGWKIGPFLAQKITDKSRYGRL